MNCGNQDFTKKCEELESRQKNAVEVLEQENHKQLEQIKKLQEQVKVKAEIVDRYNTKICPVRLFNDMPLI